MYADELRTLSVHARKAATNTINRSRYFNVKKKDRNVNVEEPQRPTPNTWSAKVAWAVFDFFYLFMQSSSIHGFNHLTARKRNFLEYLLWLVCLILAATGAALISISTWERYQKNPTVISMDRDSMEWNTSFPAITVCPSMKYNATAVLAFVSNMRNVNEDDMVEFLKQLAEATYESFSNVTVYASNPILPKDYLNIVMQNGIDFVYLPVSSVAGVVPLVVRHMSEMGFCYSYNAFVAPYDMPEVWQNESNLIEVSVLSGNELDGDFFAQMLDMNSPAQLYIHGPGEVPDCATRKMVIGDKQYKSVELSALSTITTDDACSLSINQRKCRLHTESNLRISPIYTYNLCRMECRLTQAHKLCGCIPYFYKPMNNLKVCDPAGMQCLGKYHDSLVRLLVPGSSGEKLDCKCLPTCDDVNYVIELHSDVSWPTGSNVKWSLQRFPQMRLKRDVLFGFTDVLVSIGGTAGLFLGCSILSFIEIFYFFTLRLFWYILRGNRI